MAKKIKLKLSKFGKLLISRPAGKEAFLAFWAYSKPIQMNSVIELDFSGVISLAPSWLDEFITLGREKNLSFEFTSTRNPSVIQTLKTLEQQDAPAKLHPWRICALGEHWVREHPRRIRSAPGVTSVEGHCCRNPSKKDSIYFDEIERMSFDFDSLRKTRTIAVPLPDPKGFQNGNEYDSLIAGWTQYWNDVLKPEPRLDPNLVKALIASESGFQIKPMGTKALGLMQLMPETTRALGNVKGELKDHLIHLTKEEVLNPNANICSGIRWLIHKKKLASMKLRREANWIESVAEYKAVLKDKKNNPKKYEKNMAQFLNYLKTLESR